MYPNLPFGFGSEEGWKLVNTLGKGFAYALESCRTVAVYGFLKKAGF